MASCDRCERRHGIVEGMGMRAGKRRQAVWILVGVVALGGAVAWRVMPRPKPAATQEMRNATGTLTSMEVPDLPQPNTPKDPKTARERTLAAAYQLRGKPYDWGSKGPDAYDCSGLTKAAYAAGGVRLPDGSFNQARGEQPLDDIDQLERGDLLFYRWAGRDPVSHVTMYAGDGWVIGTGSPGQPKRVLVYPLSDDLRDDGRVITYRHIEFSDER